jgi:hypothetical protein
VISVFWYIFLFCPDKGDISITVGLNPRQQVPANLNYGVVEQCDRQFNHFLVFIPENRFFFQRFTPHVGINQIRWDNLHLMLA